MTPPKKWIPRQWQRYWFILFDDAGRVEVRLATRTATSHKDYLNNAFRTKAEAMKAAKKIRSILGGPNGKE